MFRRFMIALCAMSMGSALALHAQQSEEPVRQIHRSGPRFGITFLSAGIVDTLRTGYNVDVAPVVTQFGWQFEKQFATSRHGPVALSEWVLLVGGLEQGVFLPSISWLVGMRLPNQVEFAVGPNVTPAGAAIAFSAGVTYQVGALAVPVNFAIVPSKSGVRTSVLTGFNLFR